MSLADELDNITTRTYPDDFGLGFYPHRHYHRTNPSLQLSMPSDTEWLEQRRPTRKYFESEPNSIGDNDDNDDDDYQINNSNQLASSVKDDNDDAESGGHLTKRYQLPNGSPNILTVKLPNQETGQSPNTKKLMKDDWSNNSRSLSSDTSSPKIAPAAEVKKPKEKTKPFKNNAIKSKSK